MKQSEKLIKIINDMMTEAESEQSLIKYFSLRDILKKIKDNITIEELEELVKHQKYSKETDNRIKFFLSNFDDFDKCFLEYSDLPISQCIKWDSCNLKECLTEIAIVTQQQTSRCLFEEIKKRFLFYKEE